MSAEDFNPSAELERYKAQLALHLEHQKALWSASEAMSRLVGDFALLTIRSLLGSTAAQGTVAARP
jgi:hypothetical protein